MIRDYVRYVLGYVLLVVVILGLMIVFGCGGADSKSKHTIESMPILPTVEDSTPRAVVIGADSSSGKQKKLNKHERFIIKSTISMYTNKLDCENKGWVAPLLIDGTIRGSSFELCYLQGILTDYSNSGKDISQYQEYLNIPHICEYHK